MDIETLQAILRTTDGLRDIVVEMKELEAKVLVRGPVYVLGVPYVFEVEIDLEDMPECTPPLALAFGARILESVERFTQRRTGDPHELPLAPLVP